MNEKQNIILMQDSEEMAVNFETDGFDRCSRSYNRLITTLRRCGEIPEDGLSPHVVNELVSRFASIDSNNRFDLMSVGAGEREGRIQSETVSRLHLGLSHGIGRSGNLCERQPKAIGSSTLAQIANMLALDAIRTLGITHAKNALIVPVATGMALMLCLNAWRRTKPSANSVVFLRVDQRSCFKAITTCGFKPIVIDCFSNNDDCLTTDTDKLASVLDGQGDSILAVLSTTSCFAPRSPDRLRVIGQLCKDARVKHLVNNAYGLQSSICRDLINTVGEINQIDAVVQSLDKNFLVPVGGALIITFLESSINHIASAYPGRASIVPSRDLLITLLEMGRAGLRQLYVAQAENFFTLRRDLLEFTSSVNERIFDLNENLISIAMTLGGLSKAEQIELGRALFSRGITGARVVTCGDCKNVDGFDFVNYGSHSSSAHSGYLNVACAIGMSKTEIAELLKRLKHSYNAISYAKRVPIGDAS